MRCVYRAVNGHVTRTSNEFDDLILDQVGWAFTFVQHRTVVQVGIWQMVVVPVYQQVTEDTEDDLAL